MPRYSFLRINRKITITQPRSGKSFSTVIQDVAEEYFAVLAPEVTEVVLSIGEKVKAVVPAPDAKYEFETTLARQAFDPVFLYYFHTPQAVRRIQERTFVRAKAALEISYTVLTDPSLEELPVGMLLPDKKAYTVDLSGGGVQLILREKPEIDSLLLLSLPLPDGQETPLLVRGRVKRAVPRVIKGQECYEVGVAFEGLTYKEEDRLVSFVFQRLREERQQER
ncbi:MAG: flagellar brake protein [Moorellaceae bacterium]